MPKCDTCTHKRTCIDGANYRYAKECKRYATMADLVDERDEALRSLDKAKIMAYARKYNVQLPDDEMIFWAEIHKARTCITTFTAEEKKLSYDWLIQHGFKGGIK